MLIPLIEFILLILFGSLLLFEIIVFIRLIVIAFNGAPYVTTDDRTLQEIITIVKARKAKKVVDLGSGDGKVILALAREGIEAHGVEFNPLLTLFTKWRIKRLGLGKKAHIHRRDMWKENVTQYDVIIVYQISYIMKKMERKLKTEIKPGTMVLSNDFTFPNWKAKKKIGNISIYTT